ncbi:MAG: helix-hairpin-helix domain-containing protein [Coprothermobacterota bacterium]|nr:helix-hairpin-helix domain-containing protein [Coprothermobacterota bacterium]
MRIRKNSFIVLLVASLILLLSGCYRSPQIVIENTASPSLSPAEIYVHVAGEVHLPGLYKLTQGARVADAIKLAGGATSDADMDALNLAMPLKDGDKIVVPKKASQGSENPEIHAGIQVPSTANQNQESGSLQSGGTSKININTASAKELESLPGIGPVLAQRIVDYRAQKGGFKSIEEIKEVSGIGDKRFEAIKDLITVK